MQAVKDIKNDRGISRRDFLWFTGAAGTGAMLIGPRFVLAGNVRLAADDMLRYDPLETDAAVKVIRTGCFMCNAGCGIQVKVHQESGIALKIDGNPYSPQNNEYDAAGSETVPGDITSPDSYPGTTCARGQGGLMTVYDPYRVKTPLKRVGPRGSGKWQAISWSQALSEIANGSTFATGESFTGLKDILKPASALTADPGAAGTTLTVGSTAGFAGSGYVWIESECVQYTSTTGTTFDGCTRGALGTSAAAHAIGKWVIAALDSTDSAYTADAKYGTPAWYGHKGNRMAIARGRDQNKTINTRFLTKSFGSKNYLPHTSFCNAAWYLCNKHTYPNYLDTSSYSIDSKYSRADLKNVKFLVIWGSSPVEANVPTVTWSRWIADIKQNGGEIIVIDPRFSNTAAKGKWVPIKPGTDTALAFAIIRQLIDNNWYHSGYLSTPNTTRAAAIGYKNYSDAAYLVKQSDPQQYLHSGELASPTNMTLGSNGGSISSGLSGGAAKIYISGTDWSKLPSSGFLRIDSEFLWYQSKATDGGGNYVTGIIRAANYSSAASHTDGTGVYVAFCVKRASDGAIVPYDGTFGSPASDWQVDMATLDVTDTVGSTTVKTAFTMLKDEVSQKTAAEWEAICDLPALSWLPSGTSLSGYIAGKYNTVTESCTEFYRNTQQTNGYYVGKAILAIDVLMDRNDRKGGRGIAKRYGGKDPSTAGTVNDVGVNLVRLGSKYEGGATTPTRMWYPAGFEVVSSEIWPSIKQSYPYRLLALINYVNNPAYTACANQTVIDHLKDTGKLPLHIAVTIFMDETASHADYILPDSTYFERVSTPMTSYPTVKTKAGTLRRPVIGRYRSVTISGRAATAYIPAGSNLNGTSFAAVSDLLAAWDGPMAYEDILINLAKTIDTAAGGGTIFGTNFGANAMGAGNHLDTSAQLWDKYLSGGDFTGGLGDELTADAQGRPGYGTGQYLVMGGRFNDPAQYLDAADSNWLNTKYGSLITLFSQKAPQYKNPYTGAHFSGIAKYEQAGVGLKGTLPTDSGYPYFLLTFKRAWHVQSRSSSNEWLSEIAPQGYVWIATTDTSTLGVKTGDKIKITSPTNTDGVEGVAWVTENVRPGCVVVEHHYGRTFFGRQPYYVNGVASAYDANLMKGAHGNPVMRTDPDFGDMGLTDALSGTAGAFSVSKVNIVKI